MKRLSFIWPQEPFLPSSLFKHYCYLGEVASYARKLGEVKLKDLSVEPCSRKDITKLFEESDFVFIPVEVYNVKNAASLAHLVKQSGNARSVAYGSVASLNPGFLSNHFDNVLANGHWETAISKLVLDTSAFLQRTNNGVYNVVEPLDGESWAFPSLDLLPTQKYLQISPGQLEINVQKGCLFNCSFCLEKSLIPGANIHQRAPRSTAEFLEKNPGFSFYVDATTFSQNKEWAFETCDRLSRINPIRKWRTVTRVDKIDSEIASAMARSGCYKVGFGVETLFGSTQKGIRKVLSEDQIKYAVQTLRENGIAPRAFLILGLPNQTAEEVRYTSEFISGLGIESRWKEYLPLEKVSTMNSFEDFSYFERGSYLMHNIPGISKEEYLKILATSR